MQLINLSHTRALGIHSSKVVIYKRVLLYPDEYMKRFKLSLSDYYSYHAHKGTGPHNIHEVLEPVRQKVKLSRYRLPHQEKQECERRKRHMRKCYENNI